MSKKHLEEQKLLIENFNKWINEEKCGEKDLDETAEPIEEDEELDEILGISAAGVAALTTKFFTAFYSLMKAFNNFTRITDEIMSSPDAPKQLKDVASGVSTAGEDMKPAAGPIADEIPLKTKLTHQAISALAKKFLGIQIDIGNVKDMIPSSTDEPEEQGSPEPQEEPEPEPEDSESRRKLGLMSKDKEDRLKQLRDKYRE